LDTLYTHGEITFAANKIAVIFPKTNWRPTYYLVFDEYYQRTMIDIMSKTTAEKKIFDVNSFLWTRKVTGDCVFLRGIHGRKWLRHPRFSENIYKNIYDIATVTYDSMQLAVYMGFKEIYLLGMDNMYANDKNKAAIQYEMNTAYQYAGQYADAHGINIINATRGGYLEIFPRAEFARLF
jgi:hypothetical protein